MPRHLEPGWSWQEYYLQPAVRLMRKAYFDTDLQGSPSVLKDMYDVWVADVQAFIYRRAEHLGLEVEFLVAQLIEQPDESKAIEVLIWESHGLHCVFSLYGQLSGPIPEALRQPQPIYLPGFWPCEVEVLGSAVGIMDARVLSKLEARAWDARTIQVGASA